MKQLLRIILIPILLLGLTLCFTSCKPKPTLAVVTTSIVNGITQVSATAGGNVTDDGNAEITARGVCWATTHNPTTGSNKTSDGTGTGSFTSSITGLTPGVIYYVRAYATNSEGTSYGNEVTFSSNPVLLATLTTTIASSISETTAVSGGIITLDGGGEITGRGVCWSTASNPTITLTTKTSDGTGTGTFTSNISGLTENTKYYIRAYAINSAGTAYGDEKFFTTEASKTVTDIDGNVYNTVTIGTQTWMKENLKTTKYRNGNLIGTTTPAALDITNESTPKYQWAYDGNESNVATYGRLYTWYAITDSRGICPAGWHIPTSDEHLTFWNSIGGTSNQEMADRLKEVGNAHWYSTSTGTNLTGFTALPSGTRLHNGDFMWLGTSFYFWNSTPDPWYPTTTGNVIYVSGETFITGMGFNDAASVRCLKD